MRTPERRWHPRLWFAIGPACIVAIIAAIWNRPSQPAPVSLSDDGPPDAPAMIDREEPVEEAGGA